MTRKSQSRGRCHFCDREMTRSGLTKHLASCPERQTAIAAADAGPGKAQTLYHLVVRDAYGGDYWLHLEMQGEATLEKLDRYLRAIWLECCGHLSRFSVGGWGGREISMRRKGVQVFHSDVELEHVYDFGTSSETLIQVAATRTGKSLTKHSIFLMARNAPPAISCMYCDNPATYLCLACLYDEELEGTLCDTHLSDHPHQDDEFGPIPIVNSPRLGMCGYMGPAEPPY